MLQVIKRDGRTVQFDKSKIRNAALQYAFTLIIAVLCALKIVGVLCERMFDVDGLKMIFIGVFFQSVYFLIVKFGLY